MSRIESGEVYVRQKRSESHCDLTDEVIGPESHILTIESNSGIYRFQTHLTKITTLIEYIDTLEDSDDKSIPTLRRVYQGKFETKCMVCGKCLKSKSVIVFDRAGDILIHTSCAYKFIKRLEEIIENNQSEITAYNI